MMTISKQILHGFKKSLILSLLLIVTTNAQTNYYIATSGNDSNDGKSPSKAWKSLTKVWGSWSQVQPGDSILFKRGDIWAPTTTQAPGSMLRVLNRLQGTADNLIVIGAYGSGTKPIISAENHPTPNSIQVLRSGAMRYLEIRDIEFRGLIEFRTQDDLQLGVQDFRFINNTLDGSFCGGKIAFRSNYSWENSQVPDSNHAAPLTRVELGYNLINNTTNGDAVNFVAPGDSLWIHHNSWFNATFEEALDIAGGFGHIVEYNFISGAKKQGMKIHSQFNPLINATIRGNIIVRGVNGDYTSGMAIVLQNVRSCKIYNNTFIGGIGGYSAFLGDSDTDGIRAYFGSFEDNIIENNIFYGIVGIFGKYNDVVNKIGERNTFKNNIYWSNQYSDYVFRIDQIPIIYIHKSEQNKFLTEWQSKTASSEKMADPLFENPIWTDILNYGDYNLREGSPAINSATSKPEYSEDFNGTPVPQDGIPDRGALEKVSVDNTNPTLDSLEVQNSTTLILTFSEKLESSSAQSVSNYLIDNGVVVNSASINVEGNIVALSISELTPAVNYNLTVQNIQDLNGNVINPNNTVQFYLSNSIPQLNLLNNGDFECNSFIGWQESNTYGGATYSANINSNSPISGSYDAVISVNSAGTSNSRPLLLAFLSQNTEIGKVYTLNFKTKVKSGSPKIQYIYLGDQVIPSNLSLSGEQTWTFVSNPVSTPKDFVGFYVDGTITGSFSIDEISYTTEAQPILAKIKVLLQGPYSNGLMNTYLRDAGYVPTTQPYNAAPWNYSGTENVSSVPANVVDWILVELRSTTSAASLVTKQAGFLLNDGRVVAADVTSDMTFSSISEGDYYIVIKHRNHLSIMSAAAVHLNNSSQLYDFTQPGKVYGFNPMINVGSSVFAMVSGDGNATGSVTASDNNLCWRPENGQLGYLCSDFNLSGSVTASDSNLQWRVNNGQLSQVPNN